MSMSSGSKIRLSDGYRIRDSRHSRSRQSRHTAAAGLLLAAVGMTCASTVSAQGYVWDDDSYVGPEATASAEYKGVHTIHTLTRGQVQADAWVNEQITLFAPQGRLPDDVARRWTEWYRQADDLYRKISNMPNFDRVYRRTDPVNFGPGQKVIGFWQSCGAGCGNKTQAEVDPGFIDNLLDNPDNPLEWGHWIVYYEMARGGRSEPFYGRATWPANTVLMPHLMAGIIFHHFGGDDGVGVHIPGTLLNGLDNWSALDHEWVDWFSTPNQQKVEGAPASHDLMAAMLYRVLIETDIDVVARVMDQMTAKPEAENATQAMCDFQDSIISQTGTRFISRMKGPWGLPDQCAGQQPQPEPQPEPQPQPPSCDAPEFDAATESALLTWVDCDGVVRLVAIGGEGGYGSFSGRAYADASFTSAESGRLESTDTFTRESDAEVNFRITTGGGAYDEIRLSASNGGAICLDVSSARPSGIANVYFGAGREVMSGAFDPSTGQACTPPASGGS